MTNDDATASFQSHTREVVKSFLKTVVILDDLDVMSPSNVESISETPSGPLISPEFNLPQSSSENVNDRNLQGVPLKADEVISSFADIGSVCAVLKPAPGDQFRERTSMAARSADIVILDWKIHDSTGDETMEVMREILREDRQRLRLIAIYTGEPDLPDIYERVQGVVAEFYEDSEPVVTDGFRIVKGPLGVVVLAKEGTTNHFRPELQEQEVEERQLADRLVREFALMTGGLVRNSALAGITAIRDNAHRILAKFKQSLDPAYLGHRLMLPHPPDSEDHLVEALGSELLSVIEESRSGAHADMNSIRSWLTLRESQGLDLVAPFAFQGSEDPIQRWCNLLSYGIGAADNALRGGVGKTSMSRQATEPFSENEEEAMRSNRRFAALLNLKTRYPGRLPRLTMGTILRTQEGDNNRYFLCLQPKCDSVRLHETTGFPFINLIPLEDVQVDVSGPSLQVVVETGKGEWKDLGIIPKPSELSTRFFEPDKNPPREIVAKEGLPGEFYFEDDDNKQYLWVAQMKDEHALGVAGEVASALARPGPNDAEWLRRASGSSSSTAS